MHWRRGFAALIVVLALTECAQGIGGQAGTPDTPHQQDSPRDTSGMH